MFICCAGSGFLVCRSASAVVPVNSGTYLEAIGFKAPRCSSEYAYLGSFVLIAL
jgi:hypothetical protein